MVSEHLIGFAECGLGSGSVWLASALRTYTQSRDKGSYIRYKKWHEWRWYIECMIHNWSTNKGIVICNIFTLVSPDNQKTWEKRVCNAEWMRSWWCVCLSVCSVYVWLRVVMAETETDCDQRGYIKRDWLRGRACEWKKRLREDTLHPLVTGLNLWERWM